jgi:hypothetical protein
LYSLHYRALVRLAVLLVRDVPTAEEVVQDSFVAIHDAWSFQGRAEPRREAGVRRVILEMQHHEPAEPGHPHWISC